LLFLPPFLSLSPFSSFLSLAISLFSLFFFCLLLRLKLKNIYLQGEEVENRV
jgi:hypothetical protein